MILSYCIVALTGIIVVPKNTQLVCTCKKKKTTKPNQQQNNKKNPSKKKGKDNYRNNAFHLKPFHRSVACEFYLKT